MYFGSPLNRFFVCEMDDVIEKTKPKYFFHGHTHSKIDYQLFNTKVICNPHGYPDENKIFDFNTFIEV